MDYYIHKVGWCLICNQGWVEINKDKNSKELFVCCEECEAMWEHPNDIREVDIAKLTFESEIELVQPTNDDILNKGWDKYILRTE
jgi:hypothetical protein